MTKKRVAIIGAGASGLPAIRHALLYGIEPVCFELTSDIGGLWRYKNHERHFKGSYLSSVMKTTILNTSKEMTAYSDFPPHPECANYMHNKDLLKYLEDYIDHFGLRKYIKFNHKVESIQRSDNFDSTGKWKINYQDEDGDLHTEIFDGVLMANGHHSTPHYPKDYPEQKNYKGKIMHSHEYTDYHGFEDKNVIVVGIGNSGADIAVELAGISKNVYLVSRRGTWLYHRLDERGYPLDINITTRLRLLAKEYLPWLAQKMIENKLEKRVNHSVYGLKPKHSIGAAHATLNDELALKIASRTVKLKPNITKFKGNDVMFEDLTEAEDVDAVIFATGYWFDFQMIENGELIPVIKNETDLYLHMFSPNLSKHNSLAIIGLIQPTGSIMPISEMQSRLFYSQLTGKITLPDKDTMYQNIEKMKQIRFSRYVNSPRHTIQIDFDSYIDELAEIIGCKPKILNYLWNDPVLGQRLLFGPITSYTYRLCGPYPWDKARETILTTEYRIKAGFAPEGESSSMSRNMDIYMQSDFPSLFSISIFIFLSFFIYKFLL